MRARRTVPTESAAELIGRTVQAWALQCGLPEKAPVTAACQLAAEEFRQGASVLDACAAGRRLLRSWMNHPSTQRFQTATTQSGPLVRIGAA